MAITVKNSTVTVEDDDLDIYLAEELKSALLQLYEKGKKKISLDLGAVDRITTPAAQVILSAKKSFQEVKIKNPGVSVTLDLQKIGVDL